MVHFTDTDDVTVQLIPGGEESLRAPAEADASIVTPGGVGKAGRRLLPSWISRLQRRAISIEFSSACGISVKSCAISSWRLKYCSGVKSFGRR